MADSAVHQTEPLHLLHRHLQQEDLQVRIHLKDTQLREACMLTQRRTVVSILLVVNHHHIN